MKFIVLTVVTILSSIVSFAQEKASQNITVTIDNIKNDTGKIILSLHDETTFLVADGIQNKETEIKDGKIKVTFKNVQPGSYAIMALHDENKNNAMDFDTNRMPLESYGMSNNPLGYGPPQYRDAKFEVKNEDINMTIRF